MEGDPLISKRNKGSHCNPNFLDEFYMPSQDFPMTPPPNNQPQSPVTENALFVIRVKYDKANKLIHLIFDKGIPIKQFMSQAAKDQIGLSHLTDQQWANFDSFLDPDKVLAPGDPPH